MDIFTIVVARVKNIDHGSGEWHGQTVEPDRNPRIVFLNARLVGGKPTFLFPNTELVVTESQSLEVVACHKDLDIDVANVWLRDYCYDRDQKLKGIEWGEAIELVWDGKCYRELGATEPGEGLFMFGSSYGGDGIKLPIATKLGTRSIFYKEGEGDEEGSIKRPPMGFQMGMKA